LYKKSFKLKLIFSYILVVLISFGCITIFLDKKLEESTLHNIEFSLISQARIIENQITSESLKKDDPTHLEELVSILSKSGSCRLTVINNQGKVLADSDKSLKEIPEMENHLSRPEIKVALGNNIGSDIRYSATLKIDMLYVALPLKEKNEIVGVLRLALPLTVVQTTLFEIRRIILLGLLFALCFALVLGFILAVRTLKPINKMINVARKYATGDFSIKVPRLSQDEIGELGVALNKIANDIEEKITEIQSKNQHLAAILNSMIEGVIVVDGSGSIISINPTVEKIFDVTKDEAEGKSLLEAVRNNDISEVINQVLSSSEPVSKELILSWPVQRIFQINASPVFEKGRISGCLAVIHDITEIRKLETMRKDFVANVSHELKTPLTSIKGFVETLLEGALEDKENSRHFLKIIQDHANRLNNLINDLLDLSSIESNKVGLEVEDLNLKELTDKVLTGFKSQIKKRFLEVQNDLNAGILVRADKAKIEQVLTNLIDNAIKFNKDNGVIKVYSQESSGRVKIIVEDSGLGIPAKDLPRVFERFYRVDKARSRELGGTGLGLSIVKHIIELHGGSAGVESTEGMGSKFWFILPVK